MTAFDIITMELPEHIAVSEYGTPYCADCGVVYPEDAHVASPVCPYQNMRNGVRLSPWEVRAKDNTLPTFDTLQGNRAYVR